MAMSKKDYVAIAAIIKGQIEASPSDNVKGALRNVAANMAIRFAADNDKFQRSRFIEACGAGSSGDILPPGAKLARAANSANGR